MNNTKDRIGRKILTGLGIVPIFAVGLMFMVFSSVQIIIKHNYTPVSFTFTFLAGGALIGLALAYRVMIRMNGVR